jgi:hypothetical protein
VAKAVGLITVVTVTCCKALEMLALEHSLLAVLELVLVFISNGYFSSKPNSTASRWGIVDKAIKRESKIPVPVSEAISVSFTVARSHIKSIHTTLDFAVHLIPHRIRGPIQTRDPSRTSERFGCLVQFKGKEDRRLSW